MSVDEVIQLVEDKLKDQKNFIEAVRPLSSQQQHLNL